MVSQDRGHRKNKTTKQQNGAGKSRAVGFSLTNEGPN
jgi:hypothetical protein